MRLAQLDLVSRVLYWVRGRGPETKTKLKESNFKFGLPYYLFQ